MRNERVKILRIWVDTISRKEAINAVEGFLKYGSRPHSIFASNPEKNFSFSKERVLHAGLQSVDLILPDGIGMVAAVRILHGKRIKRIPGSEFIFDICRLAERKQYKIFVYGAKEVVNRTAVMELQKRYPRLVIAGRSSGYVSEKNMPKLIDKINTSGAQILFLALGSPRQEKWFFQYRNFLQYVRVCQGLGGTVDTIAGTVNRAPEFWQSWNLEWMYRLLQEPKRIKRQKYLFLFAGLVFYQKLKEMIRTTDE